MTGRYEEILLPEQRDRIVENVVNALKSKERLSAKTVNDFRDAFRASKPIPGFNKDPLRAAAPLLKQHILGRMDWDFDYERHIVSVWVDTEPQLQEAVEEHLDSLDGQIYDSDEIDEEFWDAQISLLANKHSEYEEKDILLMTKVLYDYAKIQADSQKESTEVVADVQTAPGGADAIEQSLNDLLVSLRDLPATLSLWQESVPQFVGSLNEIIDQKNDDLVQLKGLVDDLDGIQSEFQAELAFFRHGEENWDALILASTLVTAHGMDDSTRRIAGLKHTIASYRQIKERADTLSEERERREKRHELEETIEGMLSEIDELAYAIAAESEARSDTANDVQQQTQSEADPQLREDFDVLKRENEALLDSNRAIKRDAESLSAANCVLRGEVAGLNADKGALANEVAELKDQLQISEAKELSWRNAYEAEMGGKNTSAPEPIPSEIASIRQALELAKARYGDRLAISLNKKSDRDYDYTRPKEVWDALEWLATVYHPTQTGEARVIDLNESIRNTCGGWEYKANQTDITFSIYREWYTTTKDGATYELRKHIGKGTGRDNNVIRVAFDWDEDSQRVLVGYIGPHQRNRVS